MQYDLCHMAINKKTEKTTAYHMYVEQGKSVSEIASIINVSTRTVSEWVNKGKWKEALNAKVNGVKERSENIKKVLNDITEQTIELQKKRKEASINGDKEALKLINIELVGLADQASKWNKTLEMLEKKEEITLGIYLNVMEDVFDNMSRYDNALFLKTLDFQQQHILSTSQRLG